jgi:hypothetical protein
VSFRIGLIRAWLTGDNGQVPVTFPMDIAEFNNERVGGKWPWLVLALIIVIIGLGMSSSGYLQL